MNNIDEWTYKYFVPPGDEITEIDFIHSVLRDDLGIEVGGHQTLMLLTGPYLQNKRIARAQKYCWLFWLRYRLELV